MIDKDLTKDKPKGRLTTKIVLGTMSISALVGGFVGKKIGYNKGFSEAQKNVRVVRKTLNRGEMFKQGIGLPPDYWSPGWGSYPGFINEQKHILEEVCLYGTYTDFAKNYLSQEYADSLLKLYGWKE